MYDSGSVKLFKNANNNIASSPNYYVVHKTTKPIVNDNMNIVFSLDR